MNSFTIVDADAHVIETAEGLKPYLKEENRRRPLWPGESWDRSFGGTLGKENNGDPQVQIADMEEDGVDIQVL